MAFRVDTRSHPVWYEQQRPGAEQVVHTHRTSCGRGWPRGFGALNSSPLSWNIHFRLGGFQSLERLHCPKAWHKTYPICNALLLRSARRTLASSQKSRRNHRSYVWTEPYPVWFSYRRKSYSVKCEHSLVLNISPRGWEKLFTPSYVTMSAPPRPHPAPPRTHLKIWIRPW